MKVKFTGISRFPESDLRRNEEATRLLKLPEVGTKKVKDRLAIVGGSPSVVWYADEIRAFDGDILAVNGAFHWCRDNGIDAAFYSIDPHPVIAGMARGAMRAILSHRCDPSVFAELSDSDVEVYSGEHIGPSSATNATLLGILRGHKSVTFYGCACDLDADGIEGSPSPSPITHGGRMLVAADGREFMTDPGLMMQAETLAEIIRAAPEVFIERSDGLLGALVRNPDLDVLKVSRSVYDTLRIG